ENDMPVPVGEPQRDDNCGVSALLRFIVIGKGQTARLPFLTCTESIRVDGHGKARYGANV
ncbi:MAG TPA: hypothetical protein VGK38_12100, partial [Prolixibacteraceae bacterium]